MASPLVEALTVQGQGGRPPPNSISPANVLGAYQLASQVAEQNYAEKIAKQNAQFGGLAQIGGAGLAAFGPKAYSGLFGTPASPSLAAGTPAQPGLLSGLWPFGGGQAAVNAPAAGAPAGFASTDAELSGGITGTGGVAAPAATVASDMGLAGAPAAAGTVAGDLAAAPAAGAAGAGLADAGAAAGAGGLADAGAAGASALPDWLASLLPFLAAA